jgi:nucleoside-diphosphate-sugar epimerase
LELLFDAGCGHRRCRIVRSHLCAHLLACGDEVVGIDMLTDYYNPALKERNLMPLRSWDSFSFHRVDLVDAPPRQRPDMAFSRLLAAVMHGRPFYLYGDGEQTRDFTYASDVVAAMRAAACSEFIGIANIGGGNQVSMNQVIATIEQLTGPGQLVRLPVAHGEVRHTGADITLARTAFGYTSTVGLTDGIAAMVEAERRTGRKQGLSRELR